MMPPLALLLRAGGTALVTGALWMSPAHVAAQTTAAAPTTQAAAAQALSPPKQPQVDTSDLLVPGSVEVIHDVQSAFAPATHQRGVVNGWQYILYPDGTARIRPEAERRRPILVVSCELAVSCSVRQAGSDTVQIPATGAPRPAFSNDMEGAELAAFVAKSILAGTGSPPNQPQQGDAQAAVSSAVSAAVSAQQPDVAPDTPSGAAAQPRVVATHAARVKEPKTAQNATPHRPTTQPKRAAQVPTRTVRRNCAQTGSCGQSATRPKVAPTLAHHTPRVAAPSQTAPSSSAPSPSAATTATRPKLTWAERHKLTCSATTTLGLTYVDPTTQDTKAGKPRISLGCFAQITERLSGRVSVLHYVIPGQKSEDDADFTYAFTYKVTDKITLSYSNYSAQFQNNGRSLGRELTSGDLRASYKLPPIKLPKDKVARCTASMGLPSPTDTSLRLFCGVSLTKKLWVGGTVHSYFPNKQESFQPDFSYTASYKISDDWRLSYANYGNNRFVWNRSQNPGRGVFGGSVSVSYTFKF